ncbi:hypothetical protein HDU93_007890 [Gonapodya sp. JEL0774]|nr:hypothetical protein HDU93_007890 [Gonapodya sp. JEL0774]
MPDLERLKERMERIKAEREARDREKKERKRKEKEAKEARKGQKGNTKAGTLDDSGVVTSGGSGSDDDPTVNSSKKRKHGDAIVPSISLGLDDDDHLADEHARKRASVNVRMPKLDTVAEKVNKTKERSEAIKSLYRNEVKEGEGEVKMSPFFAGTFHR